MSIQKSTRRSFIKNTLAATGGGAAWFYISGTKTTGQVLGANERIHAGVVGIKGRGSAHINGYIGAENVQVSHLIDVDSRQFDPRQRQIRDKTGKEAGKTSTDIREALEDNDLDVISIATCNHTHSLNAVLALQAGKHVYVEKPMSHNVWEGARWWRQRRSIRRWFSTGRSSVPIRVGRERSRR